ncbi:hypothetical protein [Legionella shakespearei]|uniref:Uncharacterized protein n=1 Tax=Legionella shakespearei DSM 23087 TaxID=1122169 RepID=A0A0W0Z2K1_9GAMM|nr:hypothetical protein [Legionella shakespearei]KTD63340.1 hypothetical protein Lsha_0760 [Legionella shakespearei DSM 23087]
MSVLRLETTGKMISALTEKDKVDLSGLSTDDEAQKLLREHPGFSKRLLALFKELNTVNIVLTAETAQIIAENLSLIASVTSMLRFFTSMDIESGLPFSRLVELSKSLESVKNAIVTLKDSGMLNQNALDLVLIHPELVSLPQFIIELQARAFSLARVSLVLEQFDAQHIETVVRLCHLLLKNDLFYYDALDILLRQKHYLEPVYKGAKKLISENRLPQSYFEVLEEEPENAVAFSKLISLLSTTAFFDYQNREHLLKICHLKTGAYLFLCHLKAQDMLTEPCLELVCSHQSVFLNNNLVEAFRAIPLLEQPTPGELESIIGFIKQGTDEEFVADKIIEILRLHHLDEPRLPSLS